ncbi:MAG: (2Fe-2S)-binding protein [Alphaproteobacteria bacterium]|nr:(2Fe-2S)-binding protein [Alphaproteobacteria bacterium]
MYICNCNGVRARQVEAAIEAGAATPRAVLRACGHEPCCGRCLPEIVERLRSRDRAPDADVRRTA